ncbi:type VII secretion protein EssC, partial [Streptococcus loxodontisalivarius]
MGLELIFYKNGIRYHQDLQDGKSLHLNQFLDLESDLVLKESQGQLYYQLADDLGQLENGQELLGISFYYIANQLCHSYDPLDKAELLLSSGKGADIYLPNFSAQLVLKKEAREWRLHCLSGTYYFNNLLTDKEEILLQDGDEISFEGLTVHIFSDEIMVSSGVEVSDSLASLAHSRYDFYEDYPDYHRSPRIIYRSSEEKISINAPGNEPTKPRDELLKLIIPPIAMIAITVLISIFYPRGIYVIMTMAMSLITTVFSIQGYFKNRKQYKEDLAERIKAYKLYLADKSIELSQLAKAQKDGQLYHYPDLGRLEKMAQVFSHRIYEKTPLHFDFLYYRLGLGQVDISYQLTYSKTERSGIKDPLETEGYALYNQNRKISDMPIVANLSHGPVGYIGPRELVLEQLQLMVNQLAFFHSYHDIQFITIMPEEEKDQWEWMRWLPHASLQDMNVRGFVYNQRTRDQVLNSLNQILKLRKAQAESKEASESSLFAPHYVVLVTDEKLILDHVIMEFFTEDPTALGCSLIFVQDVMSSLSENIQTVINIKDRNTGQLVMEEGNLKEIDFALD